MIVTSILNTTLFQQKTGFSHPHDSLWLCISFQLLNVVDSDICQVFRGQEQHGKGGHRILEVEHRIQIAQDVGQR